MDMKLDSAKIKALRESRAWSQSQLADVSGVSLRTIQRIEKSGNASLESIKAICATFNIQLNEITAEQLLDEKLAQGNSVISRFKITNQDKAASLVAFFVAFVIAFLFTR